MMDALSALIGRVSPVRLGDTPPDDAQLKQILDAGLRAADHGRLRPWKFLIMRGDARKRFGDVLADALTKRDPKALEAQVKAERDKPMRAPLLVIVAASIKDNPKIPVIEQVVAAGGAAQNMLVAAHALGLGGFWRTGAPAYDANVKRALGLKSADEIVGILYLGNVAAPGLPKKPDPSGVVEEWTAPSA